jgi:hypothetical protein
MSLKFLSDAQHSRQRRWTLTLVIVLAMLIPAAAAFAAPTSGQGTVPPDGKAPPPASVPGDICVEGTVIDWQEEPLTEGWIVFPTAPDGTSIAGKGPELDDDGNETNMFSFDSDKDGLYPGEWTFTIDYSGLIGNWESVEPYTDSFTVELEGNGHECVQIRFKLREVVVVEVYKIDSHHKLLDDWEITAEPAHGNYFASTQTEVTGDGEYVNPEGTTVDFTTGQAVFLLTPGDWVFYEAPPDDADYDAYPIIPDNARQELTVESAEDAEEGEQPYIIRFKNELKQTCIEVTKTDLPPDVPENGDGEYFLKGANLAGWEISVLRADGSEATFGYTDALGKVTFNDLPPGPYTVVEESRPGWEAEGPDEYDVDVIYSSECSLVHFVNRQVPIVYTIKGSKLDANGHFGVPGWEITIRPTEKSGYVPPVPVDGQTGDSLCTSEDSEGPSPTLSCTFTDGTGEYEFELPADDYRVPGSSYEICEEELDGWLPHTPICYTVHIPYKPGEIHVPDFVNQQVGHTESGKPNGPHTDSSSSSYCSYDHYVKPGESLFGIGSAYGVSPQAMLNANSWVRDRHNYYLKPGDVVCIP